jgi:coproporphyrinogen III oxidase-like Fe-S oxidoreductase
MTDLDGSPYQGYLYAYPHKTAYRPLRPRPALREVWAGEARDALGLYLHVPFCEMRCGFCNLFTRANPPADQVAAYLRQLRAEAGAVRDAVGEASFTVIAIGGGTPTYLTAAELADLFAVVTGLAGPVVTGRPVAVETSPATATPDRLAVLIGAGTTRLSMGVQSFLDREAHAAGRPQRRSEVERALTDIRAAGVPELNLDLIYGIAGQTPSTWDTSLRAALDWNPEELFLYPLYLRPLTGLGRRSTMEVADDERRLRLYEQGRDALLAAGYRQLSMRHFRRATVTADTALVESTVDHSCQEDGTVGLGCGARSYTAGLHYSFDYAVSVGAVRAVIDDYLSRPAGDFRSAEVGFVLDGAEQRRRWLVKSLLRTEGVDRPSWRDRFGADVLADFPELAGLADRGWLTDDTATVRLTPAGLARSDVIGPWLVSPAVRAAMARYALR